VDHALELNKALEKFFEKPGPVVIGAKPGTSCFGPGYEFAFMLNYEAKKRGLRHKFPIYYITSEPFVGHLGLGGVGSSRRVMEDLMAERDIRPTVNVKVKKVEKDHVVYEDLNGKEYQVESSLLCLCQVLWVQM
jgi:sulfide-quinone reductase (EC 1.-.-.-)